MIPGGVPDFKEDDHALIDWYETTLKELNVEVHLNTKATAELIRKNQIDGLIIATGSKPKMFNLGDNSKVYSAAQVLLKNVDAGSKVVIVGGGLVGCELALWLADQGKKVTIVEVQNKLLAINGPLCHANSEMLERLVPFKGVEVLTSAKIIKTKEDRKRG